MARTKAPAQPRLELKPLGDTSHGSSSEETTEGGRDAIGWYHEKKSNDDRNIGIGPNHDWSSHGADGFGLMCIQHDQPDGTPQQRERYRDRRTTRGEYDALESKADLSPSPADIRK